jgi:hypothetical protein
MPIIVTCSCGRQFKAKEEFAGQQARCPACGQVLTIQAQRADMEVVGEEEVISFAVEEPAKPGRAALKKAEPRRATSKPEANPVDEASVSPQAAALMLQRGFQQDAEKRFSNRFLVVSTAVIGGAIVGVLMFYALRSKPAAPGADSSAASQASASKTVAAASVKTPKEEQPLDTTGPMPEAERYVRIAINAKDGHLLANAQIFFPYDPRLKDAWLKAKDRPLPKDALNLMHSAFAGLEETRDLEQGAQPSKEMDEIEAKMLLDKDLVGSGLWLDALADSQKCKFLIFLEPCNLKVSEIKKKYGEPSKPVHSGDVTLHFYGRMVIIEAPGGEGKVQGVTRKVTK